MQNRLVPGLLGADEMETFLECMRWRVEVAATEWRRDCSAFIVSLIGVVYLVIGGWWRWFHGSWVGIAGV